MYQSSPGDRPLKHSLMTRLLRGGLFATVACYQRSDAALASMGSWLPRTPEEKPPKISEEPDAAIGPILGKADAPGLFEIVSGVAKRLGGGYPHEVRLSFLPACGVIDVAQQGPTTRSVMIIGLPCFQILTVNELTAVVAHEMVHLKLGDSQFTQTVLLFSEGLVERIGRMHPVGRWCTPRGLQSQLVSHLLRRAAWPLGRKMERTADEYASHIIGPKALANALHKMAVVQPIFREALKRFDPISRPGDNAYAFFDRAWRKLPKELFGTLSARMTAAAAVQLDDPHPPISERVEQLVGRKFRARLTRDTSTELLLDYQQLQLVLHNHMFKSRPSSVFRKSR